MIQSLCSLPTLILPLRGNVLAHGGSITSQLYKKISLKLEERFFAFGKIDAFQGHLNPLSAVNIFETCVIPVLLYGCDTWLLDSSTILLLEQY